MRQPRKKELDDHHFLFALDLALAGPRMWRSEEEVVAGEKTQLNCYWGKSVCRMSRFLISVEQMWKVHFLFEGQYLFAALNAGSPHQSAPG